MKPQLETYTRYDGEEQKKNTGVFKGCFETFTRYYGVDGENKKKRFQV